MSIDGTARPAAPSVPGSIASTPASSPASPPASVLPSTLPGRYYTDPEIFRTEQQRIFSVEWVYVGRADAISKRGDILRADVGTESVIVVRGRDGALRGFLNVCRHRGAQLCLTENSNAGNAIRCPYHAWTYGLDGALITAPNWGAMAELDRETYRLGAISVAVWHGLIWVNLDPNAAPLAEQLGPILNYRLGAEAGRIDRYRIGDLAVAARIEYDVSANWKIIHENFQECYHCGTIHPELVEQIPTFASFEKLAGGAYHQGGYHFAEGRDGFSLSGQAHFDVLPELAPDDARKYFGMVLLPNCFVSLLPDHVIVHKFTPIAPDRTAVVCEWLFPPAVIAAEGFDPADTVELFHRVNEQDFAAAQWCQPNMSSRLYQDGGVLVPTESEIIGNWYYPWYRGRMGLD
jgi:Rieske 2Fe-2S family protein